MPQITLELLQQEIDYVIANSKFGDAFECYNLLKNWLEKSGPVKNTPEYMAYNNYLIKLKFLSFNYLSNINEQAELLREYFPLSLEIDQFIFWEKLETEIISIDDLDERDAFKKKMYEALEKCDSNLISRQKYDNQEIPRRVGEWTKSFVANLGLDEFDKLKKMEYLSHNQFVQMLDVEDKNKVKELLDIYEKLRISSKTPEGYENSVVMNMDGKEIVFNHGRVEEVSGIEKIRAITSKETGQTKSSLVTARASMPTTPSVTPAVSPLIELTEVLKTYSQDSLEHKAVSQEISRLKRSEFKQSQKTDAKL